MSTENRELQTNMDSQQQLLLQHTNQLKEQLAQSLADQLQIQQRNESIEREITTLANANQHLHQQLALLHAEIEEKKKELTLAQTSHNHTLEELASVRTSYS